MSHPKDGNVGTLNGQTICSFVLIETFDEFVIIISLALTYNNTVFIFPQMEVYSLLAQIFLIYLSFI
jgi:hypothetical protein